MTIRASVVAIAIVIGLVAAVGSRPVQAQECFCLQGQDDDVIFDYRE